METNNSPKESVETVQQRVNHDPVLKKFFVVLDGRESHLMYAEEEGSLDLTHTMTAEADRGKGVAEALVLSAFKYANENNLSVIPTCRYVASYLEKHPRWQFLAREKNLKEKFSKYTPLLLLVGYCVLGATIVTDFEETGMKAWMHYVMGFFLAAFSYFKIIDLPGFKSAFKKYDLLAEKVPAYGYVYPFLEAALAVAYLSFISPDVVYAATLVIMLFSSAGVANAIYQGKDMRCGCMGTFIDLPMGSVTLIEDLSMAAMALVMLIY